MPIYEYHCTKCDQDCELLIRSEQKPVCPNCGSKKLDRQMSVPATHAASHGSNCPVSRGAADAASYCPQAGGGCCGGRCAH